MVSAGERTPDYGHTPAILVNGVGVDLCIRPCPAWPPTRRTHT